jgi:GWxTD domain-containing protein
MGYLFKLLLYFLLSAVMFILFSCRTPGVLSGLDLSDMHRTPLGFDGRLLNVNDSITRADFRFPVYLLARTLNKETGKTECSVVISFQLFTDYKSRSPVDSFSIVLREEIMSAQNYLLFHSDIKALSGRDYLCKIRLIDQLSMKEYNRLFTLNKTSRTDRNWFACESDDGEIIWDSYLPDKKIRLISYDSARISLQGRAFFHHFPAAAPPFVSKVRQPFDYKVDSTFNITLDHGISQLFAVNRQGFYNFSNDSLSPNGFTVFRTYPSYPQVSNPKRMLEGLRYLTSNHEFEILWNNAYTKEAVDSFWIANTGSVDRAVEMIRKYYQRMEEANRYFFSFCEGWKTDRGLIYIIFGPPNHVYRNDFEEFWIYGEVGNSRSLQFAFIKVDNPFTTNDYILQRQDNYKTYWYNAVKLWRR